MTYILVTNDDGVTAPGIQALALAMQELGEVKVAAPFVNQSSGGHKKTLFKDIPIARVSFPSDIPALAVTGSPADCIAVSALGLIKWPPRIVVSGINRGANMGQDLTYSGTVTAALEATVHGVPAVAVSLDDPLADHLEDYQTAAKIAVTVVRKALQNSMPPFTIMSLNVPKGKPIKGIRLTRQGFRIYRDELENNGDSVRIVGEPPTGILDEIGTDLWAVHNRYASLTPIHLDMTAHHFHADVAAWDIEL